MDADMGAGVGTRGGPTPPHTLDDAESLFDQHKADESQLAQRAILLAALRRETRSGYGMVHPEDVADLALTNRNLVGVSFSVLVRKGWLYQSPARWASKAAAAHRRKSHVYGLTAKGWDVALDLRETGRMP